MAVDPQVREKLIKELQLRYHGQMITIRSLVEMVFACMDHYNDPDLHLRVIDKLLGVDHEHD